MASLSQWQYLSPYGFSQPMAISHPYFMDSLSQWRYNLSLYRLSQSIAISQRMPLLLQPVATFWPMAISQPLWLLSAHGNISAPMASLTQPMAISQPLWLLSAHGNISAYMASLSQWQYLGQYLGAIWLLSTPIAISHPVWLLSAHSNFSAPMASLSP